MRCELGNHEAEHFASVNIQHEGSLVIFACIPCAREYDYYCDLHDQPHITLTPDGTTCLECIRELAEKNAKYGPQFLEQIEAALPPTILQDLYDLFDYDETPRPEWRVRRLLWESSARALCRRTSVKKIIGQICVEQSISIIFP